MSSPNPQDQPPAAGEAAHTPTLPLTYGEASGQIYDAFGRHLATMNGRAYVEGGVRLWPDQIARTDRDAAFIVRACNIVADLEKHGTAGNAIASLQDSRAVLLAENARLRAIAQAARAYLQIHDSKGGEDYDGSLAPLRTALAQEDRT